MARLFTPDSPLSAIILGMLMIGAIGLSLGLNQVLFVGSYVGWCGYGILTVAALIMAAIKADRAALVPVLLLVAVVLSPSALPYSFGVLLFPCAFILTRAEAMAEGKRLGQFAALATGGWGLIALLRWWQISLLPEQATHETAIRLAGENWLPPFAWPRMAMPIGHANYTAGIGLLLLPWFVGLAADKNLSRRLRHLWAGLAIISALLLISGGSRAATLALPVIFALWVTLTPASLISAKKKLILAGLGATGLAIALLLSPALLARFTNPEANTYSDLIRRDYAIGCWNMFLEKPLTGWGSGALPQAFPPFNPADATKAACYHAHSTPLQWLAEFGFAGLLLFAAITSLCAVSLYQSSRCPRAQILRRTCFAIAASGYTLFAVFDYQTNIPLLGILWGAALGLASGRAAPSSSPGQRHDGPLLRVTQLILLAVAAGTALLVAKEIPARLRVFQARQMLESNPNQAARLIAEAIELAPDNAAIHAYAAVVFRRAAESQPATSRDAIHSLVYQAWENACRYAPNYPPLKLYRAFAYSTDQPARAIPQFHAALRADPKSPLAWRGLAECYARQGDSHSAGETLALSLFVRPEHALDPQLWRGSFGIHQEFVLERFDSLIAQYRRDFPGDTRAIRDLETASRYLRAWQAARGVPIQFLRHAPRNDSAHPAQSLLKRKLPTGPDSPYNRTDALRAISAVIYQSHRLELSPEQAGVILDQFLGADPRPFSGPRTFQAPESLLHIGSYLGVSDLAETPATILLRDDLWAPSLFSGYLKPIRANKQFLLQKLNKLPHLDR